MAGPHVAGLVALIISANPALAGQVDAIEQIITQSALPLTTTQGCGGDGPTAVPNNTYGWGRIDALAAVQLAMPVHALELGKTAVPAQVKPTCTYTARIPAPNVCSSGDTHTINAESTTMPINAHPTGGRRSVSFKKRLLA